MEKKAGKEHRRRRKTLRKLHSALGLCVLIPLLGYSISGVLLVHKSDLGLDEIQVRSELVMHQYGLNLNQAPLYFPLDKVGRVIQWSGHVVLNDVLLEQIDKDILGAVYLPSGIAIATEDTLYFYDHRAKLLEAMTLGLGIPDSLILAIGITQEKRLAISTQQGTFLFKDSELINYLKVTNTSEILWSQARANLGKADKKRSKKAIIGEGIPLDRLILDVHSGVAFSWFGKLLADVFAIGTLGLIISGVMIALKKKN